jgi:hypothetical protein
MIRFEIEKLEVQHLYVKQVSSALGGMITVVDENKSRKAGREMYRKINIPHHLARQFKKVHVTTKYIKPVLSAVTFYENHVVALERHPLGNIASERYTALNGDEVAWISESEHTIDNVLMLLDKRNEFYIDGTYVFAYTKKDLDAAVPLSVDEKFKAVNMNAFRLSNLSLHGKFAPEVRTGLAFTRSNGETFVTPPIWKTLTNVGDRQFSKMDRDEDAELNVLKFDEIDEHLAVNLGFALKAGRELSEVFGYNVIEPLAFDNLMIQMRTVNLPNIATEVKQTYDIGFPFTHAVAWLIGLTNRTQTLEAYMTLRSLLKYLTTKGVYRRGAFEPQAVFKDTTSMEVPLKSIEQAADIGKVDFDTFVQMGHVANSKKTSDNTATGILYDAD